MHLIFDIETNGLTDIKKIHLICCKDILTKQTWTFHHTEDGCNNIHDGVKLLMAADTLIGHNIMSFDIPAIQQLYPSFKPKAKIIDTLIITRLIWVNLDVLDLGRMKAGRLPSRLYKSHSLEAWGYRLGEYKGDFKGPWEEWTQEMEEYCEQDVRVTDRLWRLILQQKYSQWAIDLEHGVREILNRQEKHGFLFDQEKAIALYSDLVAKKQELTDKLQLSFPPKFLPKGEFTPKRGNKKTGYYKDATMTKIDLIEFNPASRDHIADRLINKYNWQPKELTETGKPKVDESVLSTLNYPEASLLSDYMLINKRIGMLAEGAQAWLKNINPKDGRIHGKVNTMGTVTGRMSHSAPNIAQVPAASSAYGKECRELFTTPPGYVLVGCDASGLELRCLAHYMAGYDNGAYGEIVVNGDIHTANQKAAGLETRDEAKRFIYAFLYGAGDELLGSLVGGGVSAGRKVRKRFLGRIPALKALVEAVKTTAIKRKYLVGLDGRKLYIRSEHSALNVLLQSAGALVMKQALLYLDKEMRDLWFPCEFVANIHDEFQIEVKEEMADHIGHLAVTAIQNAGKAFDFRCPLDAKYKIGKNWSETH